MEQMDFVDHIFRMARDSGYFVGQNRNGDRQIDFDNKSLTAGHLRLLYQDITRKRGLYTRKDMEALVRGRPCAVVPFFELALKAGLCEPLKEGLSAFKFNLQDRADN
jgi:hypothetical protein